MCGIAGSKSRESGYDLYVQNLSRGYYSSSITILFEKDGGKLTLKRQGKFALEDIPKGGNYYLFHSRGPTVETTNFDWDDNHPFTFGKFSAAHNGIIENAVELYDNNLGNIGIDSRIIPYALDFSYRKTLNTQTAVSEVMGMLKGTFGIWILDHTDRNIRLVRHDTTLFSYGVEFSSSDPGYMKEVPQDTILRFGVGANVMAIEGEFVYAGKPKYYVSPVQKLK